MFVGEEHQQRLQAEIERRVVQAVRLFFYFRDILERIFWILPSLYHRLNSGEVHPQEIFRVFRGFSGKSKAHAKKPILGKYHYLQPGKLIFQPLVDFRNDITYWAVSNDSCQFQFKIPAKDDTVNPAVMTIYPQSDTVPENLLKIYLSFTQPMQEGEVYERVKLLNHNGHQISAPFVPLQPELWSEDNRTITLWLDPGRIKRELLSREAHGAVLSQGQSVKLVIDSSWKDVQGIPLKKVTVKDWYITFEDRISPQTRNWQINSPAAGTYETLEVSFGEVMDYASTRDALKVLNDDGEQIMGKSYLSALEKKWLFIPDRIWKSENYILEIRAVVEDLAGNNLNRLFDRDLNEDPIYYNEEYHQIPLKIAPAKTSIMAK